MGTGISGAILLQFAIERRDKEQFVQNSVRGFFDNYRALPESKNSHYEMFVIKDEVLIPNYADFLMEFYNLVYDEFKDSSAPFRDEPVESYTKRLLSCKTREEFDNAFDRKNCESGDPFITSMSISSLYCNRNRPFVFYMGSYKAILEEYSTLKHMERMLAKAMINPLKTAVQFGIYG